MELMLNKFVPNDQICETCMTLTGQRFVYFFYSNYLYILKKRQSFSKLEKILAIMAQRYIAKSLFESALLQKCNRLQRGGFSKNDESQHFYDIRQCSDLQ